MASALASPGRFAEGVHGCVLAHPSTACAHARRRVPVADAHLRSVRTPCVPRAHTVRTASSAQENACARGGNAPRTQHRNVGPDTKRRGRRERGSHTASPDGGRGGGRRGHHDDRPRPGRGRPGRVHRPPCGCAGVSRHGGLAAACRPRRLPDLHPTASPSRAGGQHRRRRRTEPPEHGADAAAGAPHRGRGRAPLRAPLARPRHAAARRHRSARAPRDRAAPAVAPLRHGRARPRRPSRPPNWQ